MGEEKRLNQEVEGIEPTDHLNNVVSGMYPLNIEGPVPGEIETEKKAKKTRPK